MEQSATSIWTTTSMSSLFGSIGVHQNLVADCFIGWCSKPCKWTPCLTRQWSSMSESTESLTTRYSGDLSQGDTPFSIIPSFHSSLASPPGAQKGFQGIVNALPAPQGGRADFLFFLHLLLNLLQKSSGAVRPLHLAVTEDIGLGNDLGQ